MKYYIYFLLLISIISCSKISPKGNMETKEIEVTDFTKIDLQGKYRLFYIHSPKNFVSVESYPNIINNLDIEVNDKTLTIKENRETQGVDFYNITLYSKYNPEKISISDSVEMNISSEIKTDNFKLNIKNNARFIGSVNSRRAEVEMGNTSRANFRGFTKDAVLKIADTASLIAPYWKLDNLHIDSRNGNYAEINVKDSLKGQLKNTAKLLYYNSPIKAFKADKTTRVENKLLE